MAKAPIDEVTQMLLQSMRDITNVDTNDNDKTAAEVKKAMTLTKMAGQMVQIGNLQLQACKFKDEAMDSHAKVPKMLSD